MTEARPSDETETRLVEARAESFQAVREARRTRWPRTMWN